MSTSAWLIVGDFGHINGMTAAAKKVADVVKILVIGSEALAQAAAASSPNALYWIASDDTMPPEVFADSAADLIKNEKPEFLLSLDDAVSRTVWAKAVIAVDAAVVGTFYDMNWFGEKKQAKRLIAEGKSVEIVETEAILAGIFDGDDTESLEEAAEIHRISAEKTSGMKFVPGGNLNTVKADGIKNAKKVIGVGYGVGSKAELELVKALAEQIGAEVGCSLPVAKQLHWFEENRVIGITHNRIAPDLYIALGVSGQPQHMSGVRDAKIIVGINNDPDAEIFRKCDYGMVGDVSQLLPIMAEQFQKN